MRNLYAWEIAAARQVLGDSLAYDRVRVHERAGWPNWINRLGRRLKGLPPPDAGTNNAITLGNHCYFPVELPLDLPVAGDRHDYVVGWLIHELTHAWQYQHLGWRYLMLALGAQFRLGDKAYDLDAPDVMAQKRAAGWTLFNYNMEQQAALTAAYYYLQRHPNQHGDLITAYSPYIADLGQAA